MHDKQVLIIKQKSSTLFYIENKQIKVKEHP